MSLLKKCVAECIGTFVLVLFGCGTAVVDQYMCVGCGICTTKCKFDAIHLEKIHDADNLEYFHTLGRIVKNVPKIGINVVKKQFGKYGGGNA